MTIQDIDTDTKEGRLLISALALLTSQPMLRIENRTVIGTQTSTGEMLKHLEELKTYIYS